MTDEQFWDNGFRHFHNAYAGYLQRLETEQKMAFRVAQWQTSILAGLQVDRKHRKKLEKALRLPWDEERKEEVRLPSAEDLKEFEKMDRYAKRLARKEAKRKTE